MKHTYGPYSVILADPPWRFKVRSAKGEGRSPVRHYSTMTLHAIKEVPVAELAAPDCALFLWATAPMMPHAFEVMAAWGFKFSTFAFVWTKPQIGLGYWTRAQTEFVLLGTRGQPRRVSRSVRQHIHAPRTRHSAKPPETRERIVQLIGDVPRVELWAREATAGWDALGNELDGCDITEGIARLLAVPIPDLAAA